MMNPNIACVIAFLVCVFVRGAYNLDYSDLEVLGIACPNLETHFKCVGYRSQLDYERGCECDTACNAYKDCCINAPRRRTNANTSARNRITCLDAGEDPEWGVYVIATCRNNWIGPLQVRQKCEGQTDFSDPLNAAPVTSEAQSVTYRNRYCAECNDADMANLKTFQLKLSCPELSPFLTDEEIYADLKYDRSLDVWGVDRMNSDNSTNFIRCSMIFGVPNYLDNSVRLCRMNMTSSCPPNYARSLVKRACQDYMAVVYGSNDIIYKNPHCAICNGITVDEIFCNKVFDSRGRPMSFALLLDVNQSDGDQVGMRRVATPQCPSGHIYDPYKKSCRQLVCALPGYRIVNGRCVQG